MSSSTPLATPEPFRQGINRLSVWSLVGWIALSGLAVAAVAALFPLAFPVAPLGEWTTTRADAVAIVKERLYDLGEMPARPYVTAVLQSNETVELRELTQLRGTGPLATSEEPVQFLGPQPLSWMVTVYQRDATLADWAYRAEVALDGTVLTLLQGVEPGFSSPVELSLEDAISQADLYLEESQFDLDEFYEPVERRVEVSNFSYQLLRYERRPVSVIQPSTPQIERPSQGLEVRFAGSELKGFLTYEEEPLDRQFDSEVRVSNQFQLAQFLTAFLLLPVVTFVFARRYHRGVVGVKRGTQVVFGVLAASLLVLAMTARSASEGLDFGASTRPSVTFGWVGLLVLIYLPALALFAGFSCAVGESMAQGTWRSRLASFDAIFRGKWANSTVAASSLRGIVCGLVLLALLFAAVVGLRDFGFPSPLTLLLGPWWPSAGLPGVVLLLAQGTFSFVTVSFCLFFLIPLLAQRVGVALAGLMASLVMTVLFFFPVVTLPTLVGLPTTWLFSLVIVWVFVRYDFLAAWLAHLVVAVGPGALTLWSAGATSLELQGMGAALVVASPLWVSARHLLGTKTYRYEYDDVPPHVRRIATRERQRVELETARGIQASILPALAPTLAGVEVAHTYVPASEVGGDFYDAIVLEDGRLAVAIGDVAGHGVSSGLIMSMVRAALAVQVRFEPEVEAVVSALNRVVCESARPSSGVKTMLTTLCYVLLDPATNKLSLASAGHLYPYRLSQGGRLESIESTAYPLGVRAKLDLELREVTLDPGDAIFLCSDGLVEARRYGGEELFGFDRLETILRKLAGEDASAIKDGVLAELEHFVSSGQSWAMDVGGRDDDLTMVVLRVPESR